MNLSLRWVAGISTGILIMLMLWAGLVGAMELQTLKANGAAQETRITLIEAKMSDIRGAQEREHRLLVQIAERIGIVVAQ